MLIFLLLLLSFVELSKLITENGGKVTDDLSASKLTHVVIDNRDESRRVELMKRTSKYVEPLGWV